ncbi:glycosyl hydrolase [Histomonas meleagridis]|uniref:glycosyl hydrolase n=1 Tax=Histomonas meleagridis TaxID=135588 RepID=UPI003559EDE2|nr:glycosyl hydrolase [Histomonas meleagridis]KAH0800796.1 glycosyl hydrolase [Histomonas meleagridis]
MFSFFLVWAFAVDQSTFRQCKDSLFCERNRFVEDQKWSVISTESKIEDNVFTVPIENPRFKNRLNLLVTFNPNFVHFKITPPTETFQRYDSSSEPTIVDQEALKARFEIEEHKNETHITLIRLNSRVEIQLNPFTIHIYDHDNLKLSAGYDDKSIFETNVNKEEYPDLFKTVEFNKYTETLKNGPTSVSMSFKFHGDVKFSGLATHTLSLNLPSTVKTGEAVTDPIRFFNTDINHFEVNSVMSMYGSIPFLVGHSTEESTGLFWCNPSETWVDVDSEEHTTRFISESGFIDFFVFCGSHKEVIQSYTTLTGKPPMPQIFSLGYHQSRWSYTSTNEVRTVTKSLDNAMIPHEAIWLDLDHTDDKKYFTFDSKNFKDIKNLTKEFSQNNRHIITLIDPHLKVERDYQIYYEAKEGNYFIKNKNNKDYFANCWPGRSGWVDFLNPSAREWWSKQYNYTLYRGSSKSIFIWNDMNEPTVFKAPDATLPRDTIHYGGYEDRDVHNLYGHFMVLSTYNGLVDRDEDKNERPFILTRSYFAGTQKYSFMWTGDNSADWDQLRNSLSQVLSLSICGYSFCGCDVGGFFNSPDYELLTRWYQLGAFCYPFFRCHCHHLSDRREPYTLKDEWFEAAKTAIQERYKLIYLWYTAAYHSSTNGTPIITPLWMEFNDPEIQEVSSQVLVDDILMVSPVLEKGAHEVNVFFPRNSRWYEFRTLNEIKNNGEVISIRNVEIEVPVFIKGGKIFALKQTLRKSATDMLNDPFELIVALDNKFEATGDVYVDDGHSFNFKKNNEFIHLNVTFENNVLKFEGDVDANKDSEFCQNFDAKIEKIQIAGLEKIPKSIRSSREDAKIHFEDVDGVLVIDAVIGLKEDCALTFEY